MKLISIVLATLVATSAAWANDQEDELIRKAIWHMLVSTNGEYGEKTIDNMESWMNNATVLTYQQARRNFVEFNASPRVTYVQIDTYERPIDKIIVMISNPSGQAAHMLKINSSLREKAYLKPSNKGKAMGIAKAKNVNLFKQLWGPHDRGAYETRCFIENYMKGKVECTTTDIDEGHGWTVGVITRWEIRPVRDDYLAFYPLELNLIEH